MKRQAFLLLCALPFTQACVLNLEVLDGVGDEQGDSEDTGTDTGEDTIDGESSSSTDAESSSSTDAESSSSTDAESSSSTIGEESSSSTDAESSSSTEEFGTSDAPPDCAEAQAEYDELVGMTDCSVDADCKIISGHCSVGLGGCYYAVNVSVDEGFLDTLAEVWSNGGCTQGVCDCAAPPAFAICDAGTCVGAG